MDEDADNTKKQLLGQIEALPRAATLTKQWVARQLMKLESDPQAMSLLKLILNEPQKESEQDSKCI
jgi:hypothetical protein